jgi:multiple sugar transport system ATP-binding protein
MEAVTMADRIAVMSGGVLQQYASPDEIFHHPVNTFVAGFIGSPAMNLLRGTFVALDGQGAIHGAGWELPLSPANAQRAAASTGDIVVGVRHGQIGLHRQARPGAIAARIYTVEPTGDLTYVHIRLGEYLLVASTDADFRAAPDDPIWVEFDQEHLHLFDATTELALADPAGSAPSPTPPPTAGEGLSAVAG